VVESLFLAGLYLFGSAAALVKRLVYQLRIYKLHAGNEQHFHERFSEQCMPIMRRYGFRHRVHERERRGGHKEFVYLLRWEGSRVAERGVEEVSCGPGLGGDQEGDGGEMGGTLWTEVQDRSLDLLPYTPSLLRFLEHVLLRARFNATFLERARVAARLKRAFSKTVRAFVVGGGH